MRNIGTRTYYTAMAGAVVMLLLLCACARTHKSNDSVTPVQVPAYKLPDTLRVATLYGPTSYFLYRDEQMGYQYELISKFAEDIKRPLKLTVASNFSDMLSLLEEGKVDILAYDVPMTGEYKDKLLYCGLINETHQVLVQRKTPEDSVITNVTELLDKDVYVEKDTKYHYRLENLSKEIGGGIKIHPLTVDSMETEDLVEMVSVGHVPYSVIDSDIAEFSSTYYDNLDVSLAVGMEQRGAWAVRKDEKGLADVIDRWAAERSADDASKELYRRYYVDSKNNIAMEEDSATFEVEEPTPVESSAPVPKGAISKYDAIFQKYAGDIGWDWRMLAAQAYEESRFDITQVSWAGARGLMQLMPRTAAGLGLSQDKITDPELNVKAAVQLIGKLDDSLRDKVPDGHERLKFILAAYNSGLAHILDAITIAKKCGMNAQVWDGNVRQALLLKSKPEYYRDPAVKYGYFKGTQTVEYVDKVLATYHRYGGK